METKKLIMALAGVGLTVAGAIAGGVIVDGVNSNNINELNNVIGDLQEEVALKESELNYLNENPITEEVIVEKIVNNTIEVEVDNGNLDLVLEHIYDNDGSVEYLTEDLDDDEIDSIVERIEFVNEIKLLAMEELENEFLREIHNMELGTVIFSRRDIDRLRFENDFNEIALENVDFKYSDADVLTTVEFRQDEVRYEADVKIVVKDNEVDEIEFVDIREA